MRRVFGLLALATLFVLCGLGEAQAQSIDDKCSSLLERTMDGSVVRVRESISVGEAVDDIESKNRRKEIEGYRIVIFSDNGQYAGDNAREVLEKFQENHPHINAYMVYESPYFKVSVGDCLTLEEASHLMAQLDDEYPELFPKREVIKYEDLANTRAEKREAVDSLQNE
jgi:hypothetical protein